MRMKHSFIRLFFNCIDPPIFSSLVIADFEARSASILILSLIAPEPNIFNLVEFLLINFNFFKRLELSVSEVFIFFLSIYD